MVLIVILEAEGNTLGDDRSLVLVAIEFMTGEELDGMLLSLFAGEVLGAAKAVVETFVSLG